MLVNSILFIIFAANFYALRQLEPPSPILDQKISADHMSDDPLSRNVYMIMGDASGEDREGVCLCAWSARFGLSYIGVPGQMVS